METTERIVEAYVRYVKRWATIPNIKCEGQFEIDLLAIDHRRLDRYHIESGLVVALDGAEFEGDARGKHKPVVGQFAAAVKINRLC